MKKPKLSSKNVQTRSDAVRPLRSHDLERAQGAGKLPPHDGFTTAAWISWD